MENRFRGGSRKMAMLKKNSDGPVRIYRAKNIKDLVIGVFRGGVSAEREISLLSGENVIKALRSKGYKVVDIDLKTRDEKVILKIIRDNFIDIVFITLHGEFGEDGQFQRILEVNNIPFTGSGSEASFLSMDKIQARRVLEENNIAVPQYWVEEEGGFKFSPSDFPLVVKPHYAGSSMGVTIVKNNSQLKEAIKIAKKYSSQTIVERYIRGRELTVGIIRDEALPIVEVRFKKDFFDFSSKYEDNQAEFIVPAELPPEIYKKIQELAYNVFKVLGCRGLGRVDLRLAEDFKPYILELNSIPGLTSHSLLPLAAREAGLDFSQLCEEILKDALETFNFIL